MIDFEKIRENHERMFGIEVGKYGEGLHRGFYSNSTHFLFELLQNAEDALALHPNKHIEVSKTVSFELDRNALKMKAVSAQSADLVLVSNLCMNLLKHLKFQVVSAISK